MLAFCQKYKECVDDVEVINQQSVLEIAWTNKKQRNNLLSFVLVCTGALKINLGRRMILIPLKI